jgi:dTDP-glucose pyrophosphorylase
MRSAKKLTIGAQATIRDAIQTIDQGAVQIALVVENDQLLGTVTDGDIRRAFLKGMELSDFITHIYNPRPIKGFISQPKEDLLQMALAAGVKQVPMVDDQGMLVGIEFVEDYLRVSEKPNRVVVMAGGLGSRLRPLTDNTPKPLLKVGSKPILETIIRNFTHYGFRNIYLSVNYKAEQIQDYFLDGMAFGAKLKYLVEDKRLGTAGALSLFPETAEHPIIIMNGDLLTNVNFEHLLNFHLLSEASATMCVRDYELQVPYGVVHSDGATIQGIEEKPIHRYYVNAGIYVLSPEVLKQIPNGQYFDMPQLFQKLIQTGCKTCSFPVREYWMDIGKPADFEQANEEYAEVFGV